MIQCTVIVQPQPSVQASFAPLVSACSLEIGVLAALQFTGTPPFTIHYSISSSSKGSSPRHFQRTYLSSRAELNIEPAASGEWTYSIDSVGDADYDNIGVNLIHRQQVYEKSDAAWVDVGTVREVRSCQGDSVQVQVHLKVSCHIPLEPHDICEADQLLFQGAAPWDLRYAINSGSAVVLSRILSSPHSFNVTIPKELRTSGGRLVLALGEPTRKTIIQGTSDLCIRVESVQDGNKCLRQLTVPDLVFVVKASLPTASFSHEGQHLVRVRDTDTVKLPLRVTGEPPWVVSYHLRGAKKIAEVVVQHPNANLVVPSLAGEYDLVAVRDRYCTGRVDAASWTVEILPRPTVALDSSPQIGTLVKNGSIIRSPVCQGVEDSIALKLTGAASFFLFCWSLHPGFC